MPRKVSFSVKCADTRVGLHVRVVGNVAALGEWDPPKGLVLNTSASDFPNWKQTEPIPLEEGKVVEYKYVICDNNGAAVRWEERANRSVHIADLVEREMVPPDGWIAITENFVAYDCDEMRFRARGGLDGVRSSSSRLQSRRNFEEMCARSKPCLEKGTSPKAIETKVLESELKKLLACTSHLQVHAIAGLKLLSRRKKRAGSVPPALTHVPLAKAMQEEVKQADEVIENDMESADTVSEVPTPTPVPLAKAMQEAKQDEDLRQNCKVSLQANAWRHTEQDEHLNACSEERQISAPATVKLTLAEACAKERPVMGLMMRREARGSQLLDGEGETDEKQPKWPDSLLNLFRQAGGQQSKASDGKQISSLKLLCGWAESPDPEKAAGGEDSHFICPNGCAAGVADGVGSFKDYKINPKHFADKLMAQASMTAGQIANEAFSTAADKACTCLREAHEAAVRDKIHGAATALVAVLDPFTAQLGVANLGDSGLRILRWSDGFGGKPRGVCIAERTSEQQHKFNTPFQLSLLTEAMKNEYEMKGIREDMPSDAVTYSFEVQEGDVVLMGTDGIFDNLHDWEICELATLAMEGCRRINPERLAEAFVEATRVRIEDPRAATAWTPFSIHAKNYGLKWLGGKMDDITVVTCVVTRMS